MNWVSVSVFVTIVMLHKLSPLSAQIVVSGTVVGRSGESLPGVGVYIPGTYDGTFTDADGSFVLETSETYPLQLEFSMIGYVTQQLMVRHVSESAGIKVILQEQISELAEVVISAGTFSAGDDKRRQVLKPLDIATTAGATADIVSALGTLPGATVTGESGRLFVRGGESREVRAFVDGAAVFEMYSPTAPNTPTRTRFLPFMFSGASFSTGGYSAEFGQALSSALILQSRDEASDDRIDLGLLSVGADATLTKKHESGSGSVKIQYTHLGPYMGLVPQRINWKRHPESLAGIAAYRHRFKNGGIWKHFAQISFGRFALADTLWHTPGELRSIEQNNRYLYYTSSYKQTFGQKSLLRAGLSVHENTDRYRLDSTGRSALGLGAWHAKIVLEHQADTRLSFKAGAEWLQSNSRQELNGLSRTLNHPVGSLFSEADYYISRRLVFRAGLRSEYVRGPAFSLDPRLSVAYQTGKYSQVSLATGRFRQLPDAQYLFSDGMLQQEKAYHYIASYQYIRRERIFRAEVYAKYYKDMATYLPSGLPVNQGRGYARGLDLFWRDSRSIRNADYWLSYSILDTRRYAGAAADGKIPSFASAHQLSAVYKHFVRVLQSQIGATFSYASPRSYMAPDDRGKLITPDYFDLSANWSWLLNSRIIVHASVSNVLGLRQVFGYEFSPAPGADGMYTAREITLPARRFLFLGVFVTFSKNRSLNQLPEL